MLVGIAVPKQNMSKSSWIIECVLTLNWNPKISKEHALKCWFYESSWFFELFPKPSTIFDSEDFQKPETQGFIISEDFQKPETQGFHNSEDFQKPGIGSFSILNLFEN